MANHIIPDEDGKGFTFAFIGGDVEFIDPISYFADRFINTRTLLYKQMLTLENPTFPEHIIEKVSVENAIKNWDEHLKEIFETKIPQNLIFLLKSTFKKEQIKLLRGLQLSPEILIAFIFKAHKDFGFVYSQYRSEQLPKTIVKGSLPKLAILNKDTGEVKKVGSTSLTDGQIKQTLEQRKVVATKFLDKGSDWHSFFITFKSIGGEESWGNGQPHFHYISDKFEISREDAVRKFKSDKYPTTSVHIELLNYGKQPEK